jgi:hypothetical protein
LPAAGTGFFVEAAAFLSGFAAAAVPFFFFVFAIPKV